MIEREARLRFPNQRWRSVVDYSIVALNVRGDIVVVSSYASTIK